MELSQSDLIDLENIEDKVNLKCGNSIYLQDMLNLKNESIDLVITSPPYGDNQTTVTYGQYSTLPMYWINNKRFFVMARKNKRIRQTTQIMSQAANERKGERNELLKSTSKTAHADYPFSA